MPPDAAGALCGRIDMKPPGPSGAGAGQDAGGTVAEGRSASVWTGVRVEHVRRAWREFGHDGGSRLSGAMAYDILFVIAPGLLLIANFAASYVGAAEASGAFAPAVEGLLGAELAGYLFALARTTTRARASTAVSVVGTLALLWAVAVFYLNLQRVFNMMWRIRVRPDAPWREVVAARARRFSVMSLPVAMMIASSVASAVHSIIERVLGEGLLGGVAEMLALAFTSSFALFLFAWLSFLVVYVFLPDARVPWRLAAVTSFWVAVGWSLGTWLFGQYLGWSSRGFIYGAASSVFVLLIWLNYSSRLVLLGCKLTRVWTEAVVGRVEPMPYAAVVRVELHDAASDAATGTERRRETP